MNNASEFLFDIADKVSMPEVYYKIRGQLENPNAKIQDYEKIVQADPMLAIRIQRIANSRFFGFNRKANDLYEAINLIGTIQLHDLLLGCLCMRTFCNIPGQVFNYAEFWRHGIQCGIVARSIARLCRVPASNRYFTLGLLLEIGHAAMFIKNPDLAFKALLESQEQNRDIDKVEREYFGFDYCQLGSELVYKWRLPDIYSQMIAHHLDPARCGQGFRAEAEIVNLAYSYCDSLGFSGLPISKIQAGQQAHLVIPNNVEEFVANEIVDNINEIFVMLAPPANDFNLANGNTGYLP